MVNLVSINISSKKKKSTHKKAKQNILNNDDINYDLIDSERRELC